MNAGSSNKVRRGRRYILAALALGAIALPAVASAHLERPSYWPDPAVDQADGEPTGGEVPEARSLGSAVTGKGPGKVRVVCKNNSLDIAKNSISKAKNKGFRLRPSQPKKKLSASKADKLRKINKDLDKMCKFNSVQKAVDESGNNDRVVIMPGRYTEPDSREAPLERPEVQPLDAHGEPERRAGAVVRVPGDVPERPELDLRPGPKGRGRAALATGPGPPRHPRAGARRLRALQPSARGLGREARGRAPRRRQRL